MTLTKGIDDILKYDKELDAVLEIIIDIQFERQFLSLNPPEVTLENISKSITQKYTFTYMNSDEEGNEFVDYDKMPEAYLAEDTDLQSVLEQFLIDGIIHCIDNKVDRENRLYFVSFKGKRFKADGGYQALATKNNAEKIRAELLEKNQRELRNTQNAMTAAQVKMMGIQTRIQDQMKRLTIWIAVGSIAAAFAGLIAAWYYIVQLAPWFRSFVQKGFGWVLSVQMATFLFVFLMGICIGTIALLIIKEVLKKSRE